MSARPAAPSIALNLPPDALRPLVAEVVAQVLAAVQADAGAVPGDRLAFSEAEAARLLDLEPHVLRDERLRGKIVASKIVGRRIRYTRDDLLGYLAARRTSAN